MTDVPDVLAQSISVDYKLGGSWSRGKQTLRALDGVSIRIEPGEGVGLVGESGSGKSTFGAALVGLAPVTSGRLSVFGTSVDGLNHAGWEGIRRRIGIVFQDPYSSLNPRMTIGDCIGEPLRIFGVDRSERRARVAEAIRQVGLETDDLGRRPGVFSGGQRQRIAIARAIVGRPSLLICDEAVSALDVSIRNQILTLLRQVRAELGCSVLFISHDLANVQRIAESVVVLRAGRVVEQGASEDVLKAPKETYTQELVKAVLTPHPGE